MKKTSIILISILLLCILSGCADNSVQKTVKIAVMGNEADFYPCYKEGIERAVRDLNKEYADSGYYTECEFYNDDGSYEEGAAIIDRLAADESVTAVIGSTDMDINNTAAYVFDKAQKLLVVPYFLYDSVYRDNNYSTVLSLCNSARMVGKMLYRAAEQTTAKRWAVCAADKKFQQAEMNGFLQCSDEKSIKIVDCVNISELTNNLDEVYARWENLGVEGVIMFPAENEGFDILKNLKRKNPSLICGGDTAFDNSIVSASDKELMQAMTGFIIADEFMLYETSVDEENLLLDMQKECYINTGNDFDIWYIQGYNAVRMTADTAIRNQTCNSAEIARILHNDGYSGFLQKFSFDENGEQKEYTYKYSVFNDEGYTTEYEIEGLGGSDE